MARIAGRSFWDAPVAYAPGLDDAAEGAGWEVSGGTRTGFAHSIASLPHTMPRAHEAVDARGRVGLFAGYLLERPAGENPAACLLASFDDDAALAALNGVFAAAVWEPEPRSLHLVSDRWGVQPLYWGRVEGGVAFGSILRSVVAAGIDGTVDFGALEEVALVGWVAGGRTLWHGVRRVQAARRITCNAGGISETRYWSGPEEGERATDDVTYVRGAGAIFQQTVSELLPRVERPVVTLSGGLDSRRLAAAIHGAGGRAPTFTAAVPFRERHTIEATIAAEVARRLDFPHTFTELPDDLASLSGKTADLVDHDTHEHALAFPVLRHIPFGGTNFDGLAGDRILGHFFEECPRKVAREGTALDVARTMFPARVRWMFSREAVERMGEPAHERVAAEIAEAPPSHARAVIYMMRSRMARAVALFGGALLGCKVGTVYPYLDNRLYDYVFSFDGRIRIGRDMQELSNAMLHPEFADVPSTHTPVRSIPRRYLVPIGDWVRTQAEQVLHRSALAITGDPEFERLLSRRMRRAIAAVLWTRRLGRFGWSLRRRAWMVPRLGWLARWHAAARDPALHRRRVADAVALLRPAERA